MTGWAPLRSFLTNLTDLQRSIVPTVASLGRRCVAFLVLQLLVSVEHWAAILQCAGTQQQSCSATRSWLTTEPFTPHVRYRTSLRMPCDAQFTPPARQDKTVLSAVSYRAVWTESRGRLAKSEQSADRSPSSRDVYWRSLGLVICDSPQRVYILRGVRRRCV